jgi:hypothetical protein
MPRFDGTGPRGEGMFTGRGQGYCALRLSEPDSGEPAIGYAGIQGQPVCVPPDPGAACGDFTPASSWGPGRRRFGRGRRLSSDNAG